MFSIGDFSKLAQVTTRLLRYYDELGLLKPRYTDQLTGYRYYTADQLVPLNRLLALKELGLPLAQIQQLVAEDVGCEQIRELYRHRKAALEQSIQTELMRLQQLELRLRQLDADPAGPAPDIVLKQVPAQPLLACRERRMSMERLYQIFEGLSQGLGAVSGAARQPPYGCIVTVLHSDAFMPEAAMDIEIGVLVKQATSQLLELPAQIRLDARVLPPVAQMATVIHRGWDDHALTYNALGRWLEKSRYRIAGPGRELLLENHYPAAPENCLMEIQFPVESVDWSELRLKQEV